MLQNAGRSSTFSILRPHLSLRPFGRDLIPWRNHLEPVQISCALTYGRLYLGSTGPAQPRQRVTCTVRFYQLSPDADGVVAVLTEGQHKTHYSVVLRHLPHRPSAYLVLRWTA